LPETDVAAQPAAIPSESSPLGGGGGIELSDADILGIDAEDTAPEATTAAPPAPPEAAAPAPEAETKAEAPKPAPEAEADTDIADDLKWMRPLLNDKAFGPKLQSMKDRLLSYQELFPKVADARAYKELLQGGPEELKSLIAKSREVDEMDLQYFSRDPEEQKGFAQNLYRDDPEAFQSMVQIGLDLIKGQSPQEYAYLTQHLVGDSLGGEKVWDWLEYIHEKAVAAGSEEVVSLLNQFAGVFQKYGLGPRSTQDPNLTLVNQQRSEVERKYQQLEAERRQDFNQAVDQTVQGSLDGEITAQLSKLLPKTSDGLRGRIARDVHSEIQKAISGDAGLKLRLQNLMRTGGINRQTQEQVANLLTSKAKQIMPGAVKRVVNEYTASVMASRKEVTDKQTQAASRVDVSTGARPGTGVRVLTRDEAREMSDMDILESNRPFRR
jgi:hypothetical protein